MHRFILKNSTEFVRTHTLLGAEAWQVLKATFPNAQVIERLQDLSFPCLVVEDAYPLITARDLRSLEVALLCGESMAIHGAYALQEVGDLAVLYPTHDKEALSSEEVYSTVLSVLQTRVIRGWQARGVLFENPATTRVDFSVTIGKNARIFGGNTLLQNTKIGQDVLLKPGNFIQNATVERGATIAASSLTNCTVNSGATVLSSTLNECTVNSGASVGPNAHLRPGTTVGSNVRVGNFVELKNAQIGANTKIAHLTYIGDATVGQNCNFGCGVVVANFDGEKKHRTVIENGCFIGCNVNLVAPLTVASGAYIAAGTTVTRSVESNAFVIGRVAARAHPNRLRFNENQIKQNIKKEYRIREKMAMKKDLTLLIMAAGIGSRFGGGVKQLQKVGPGGQLIIDYSIRDAIAAGFNKIVFVIRRDIEKDFKEIIGNRTEKLVRVEYCFQEKDDLPQGFTLPEGRTKPWGTGQAVLAAKNVINEPFAVINADDYYGKQAFVRIAEYLSAHYEEEGNYCMAGFVLKNTLSENGGVTRGVISVSEEDMLLGVKETSNIVKTQTGAGIKTESGVTPIDENLHVSMNMWGLQSSVMPMLEQGFVNFLQSVPQGDIKKEFLLPVYIDELLKAGAITVKMLETPDTWFGVTYAEDKDAVIEAFRRLTAQGVYPERFD